MQVMGRRISLYAMKRMSILVTYTPPVTTLSHPLSTPMNPRSVSSCAKPSRVARSIATLLGGRASARPCQSVDRRYLHRDGTNGKSLRPLPSIRTKHAVWNHDDGLLVQETIKRQISGNDNKNTLLVDDECDQGVSL